MADINYRDDEVDLNDAAGHGRVRKITNGSFVVAKPTEAQRARAAASGKSG